MDYIKITKPVAKYSENRWDKLLALAAFERKSLSDISRETGIPINTLFRWSKSKPRIIASFKAIAKCLGVTVEYLLDDLLVPKAQSEGDYDPEKSHLEKVEEKK